MKVISLTLGPRGIDKNIITDNISKYQMRCNNNKMISIEYYAAKTLDNVDESQDNEIGDDTTNIILFVGELIKEAKQFIEDGISPS